MQSGIKWEFETRSFTVQLRVMRDLNYSIDDHTEWLQTKILDGDYHVFNAYVEVFFKGIREPIGFASMAGCVFRANTDTHFWVDHRTPHRKGVRFFFPTLVREATQMARDHVNQFPKMRRA